MSNLLIPKPQKINDTEEIVLPFVRCEVCHGLTQTGLHQIRLLLMKAGRMQKNRITGGIRRIPPVMKRVDVYMCINCVEKGKKWPGENPIYPKR